MFGKLSFRNVTEKSFSMKKFFAMEKEKKKEFTSSFYTKRLEEKGKKAGE